MESTTASFRILRAMALKCFMMSFQSISLYQRGQQKLAFAPDLTGCLSFTLQR